MKRITAPADSKHARKAKVRAAAEAAKDRGKGKTRTPAEVDATLDLILARLADLED